MDITKYRPAFVKSQDRKVVGFPAGRTCLMCPNILDTYLQYYCSGPCISKAKQDNLYGNEEKHLAVIERENNNHAIN